jgi:trehalose 6-phosphate synthase
MKAALLEAYEADPKELERRMKAMRKTVSTNDVVAWADAFMAELTAQR